MSDYDFNREEGVAVPAILLTNTTWWPCASRLAIALTKAGCAVSAVYPASGHPLAQTSIVQHRFPYSATHPLDRLTEALRLTKPHLVVPCDDRAVEHLHELHARESGVPGSQICGVIERALGAPTSYPIVSNRYRLLRIAMEQGVPVPDTEIAVAGQALDSWAEQHKFPWVVKADGSWGGHGTRIVHRQDEAEMWVREMSKPLNATRAVKRLLVERDPFWIRSWQKRSSAQVIVQSHIEGYPANCAVWCWNGKVLAGIAVDVVCALGETGSATIVRLADDRSMMWAAERIVARLGLSGFVGFDFVVEAGTGTAYLIEMNPRATPLCHLQLGPCRDMVSAITAQLTGAPLAPAPPTTPHKMIAYFPQAWHWEPRKDFLAASFHDIPWEEPALVKELVRLPWPDRGLLARLSSIVRELGFGRRRTRNVVFQNAVAGTENAPEPQRLPAGPSSPPAVVPIQRNGCKAPLFLIHGVDGHIGRFYNLVRHLERDRPVYGILAHALLGERTALTRVEQMAAYYLKQVQSVHPGGPCHLLGFSFGGYVALELARLLRSSGEPVGMVGMIDALPMRVGQRPAEFDPVPNGVNGQPGAGSSVMVLHAKRMLQVGGLGYARDKLRARGLRMLYACLDSAGVPIPIFFQSAYDLNWFAAVRYVPQPFAGKITLFNSADSDVRARANYEIWSDLTGRNIELHEIQGLHGGIFDEPGVQNLASKVNDCLAKLQ